MKAFLTLALVVLMSITSRVVVYIHVSASHNPQLTPISVKPSIIKLLNATYVTCIPELNACSKLQVQNFQQMVRK